MKRILILGATGRTGKHALAYALTRELEVTCLVRDASKVAPHSKLRVVEGTPEKLADLERAIDGCHAIVSFLNNNRTSDSPWAAQVSPPHFLAGVASNCVAVMQARNMRRIVVLTAQGVGSSRADAPWFFRPLIDRSNLKIAFDDHAAAEAILEASELDWTAVRPVIFFGTKVKRTTISYDRVPRPGLFISRAQVAVFMIDCLQHPEFYGKAPTAS
ncbi:MAG: hypothetical protein JWN48_1228 [Myxococcaceae bacterium]|nr:hypothetical protein [Myxococcaceae bacterium]